jgi:ArsR family transcriptional regulator
VLDRQLAETYAGWFRALADPTRVQILHLLAEHGEPMTVGQIVARVAVVQSTVSQHLKILAEARFVLPRRRGTANLYRLNENCLACFPSAVDVADGKKIITFDRVTTGDGVTTSDG